MVAAAAGSWGRALGVRRGAMGEVEALLEAETLLETPLDALPEVLTRLEGSLNPLSSASGQR